MSSYICPTVCDSMTGKFSCWCRLWIQEELDTVELCIDFMTCVRRYGVERIDAGVETCDLEDKETCELEDLTQARNQIHIEDANLVESKHCEQSSDQQAQHQVRPTSEQQDRPACQHQV